MRLGRRVRRKAKDSQEDRVRKKLLSRSNWYKGRNKENYYGSNKKSNGEQQQKQKRVKYMEQKSVLFVEHTQSGELSSRLREVIGRLAPMLGFSIKVVERTGRTLKSCFPQSSL